MPPRASSAELPDQTVEQIAAALEEFLAGHPGAVMLEDGKLLFDLRERNYKLTTEHGRCTLHLWSEERNLVRRVSAATMRSGVLWLSTLRFGQTRPQTLEVVADRDRRTPSTREATRAKYLRVLERVLVKNFPEFKADRFRTAMDLEKSFGPAYARGSLLQGQSAWAVIAVNEEETTSTVDGILTLGILWLEHCRETGGGRRLYQGLKLIVPRGMADVTLSRMAWLNPRIAQWELLELDQKTEELKQRNAADDEALTTRMMHAPNLEAAQQRFAEAKTRIMALVPAPIREDVEQRVRSAGEMAFLLRGLEFARVRIGYAANSFDSAQEITIGAGRNETALTEDNPAELRELITRLSARRIAGGDRRDPFYRMQPERWMESVLRHDIEALDPHLDPAHLYTQVPASAAADRGVLDLLGVTRDGRLTVIELKAEEELHLALQGLDDWLRVRRLHRQSCDSVTGLGEFERHGYFRGVPLSADDPMLYLVVPALRIHSATEVVLRYLSPQVDWTLVALDERWRSKLKVVWRRRRGSGPF